MQLLPICAERLHKRAVPLHPKTSQINKTAGVTDIWRITTMETAIKVLTTVATVATVAVEVIKVIGEATAKR